jgi:hypothetical protein
MREAVLERDGYRCTYVDPETDERCSETTDLRCCHVFPLHELKAGDPLAYDPDNGVTRCGTHDRMTDRYAR